MFQVIEPGTAEPVKCPLFDGKTDATKVMQTDENGRYFPTTVMEEHVTLVGEPGNIILGHVAPEKKDAKTTADTIWKNLEDNDRHSDLDVIGGDSTPFTSGHKGGVFHHLQEKKGHRLLISVCKLHTNELPLRHVIRSLGIPTTSNNSYGGNIGKAVCGNVEEMEFNPDFERIHDERVTLPPLPTEVLNDLSTNQQYGYRMVQMIMGGDVDESLLALKCGPVSHARYLQMSDND